MVRSSALIQGRSATRKTILMFSVTDFTDTITVKMFVRNDQLAELLGDIKKGAFVKIKGVTTIDKFDGGS